MNTLQQSESKLPSILTFASDYLQLTEQGINPTPFQSWLLYHFYYGSLWNDGSVPNGPAGYMEAPNGVNYSEDAWEGVRRILVLVLGRRSGKDFLMSIMALYEFFRLIHGEPYNTNSDGFKGNKVVAIISPNASSSSVIFSEIKSKLLMSNFYQSVKPKITAGSIVYTDAYGQETSIKCVTKEQAIGLPIHTVFFNEAAYHKNLESAYATVAPCTATFVNELNPGKVVFSSTPRDKSDFFYELFASPAPRKLSVQASTWVANPRHTEESLRTIERAMPEDKFRMEFGAEFVESDETEQITLRDRKSVV